MKYEITLQILLINDVFVHQIRALKDIPGVVKAGELGGFVTNEHNLSQKGRCWLDTWSAIFHPDARVSGSAQLVQTKVYGAATIKDLAVVKNTVITNNVVISGFGEVINRRVVKAQKITRPITRTDYRI